MKKRKENDAQLFFNIIFLPVLADLDSEFRSTSTGSDLIDLERGLASNDRDAVQPEVTDGQTIALSAVQTMWSTAQMLCYADRGGGGGVWNASEMH